MAVFHSRDAVTNCLFEVLDILELPERKLVAGGVHTLLAAVVCQLSRLQSFQI